MRTGGIMSIVSTTKMSSKGQIVIPEDVRNRLGLKTGSQFIVLGDRDVVILKSLTPPSMDEFNDLISMARKQAQDVNLKKSDITTAIKNARARS
jgi:AbrB family looped-hinge helix DNA binding protein